MTDPDHTSTKGGAVAPQLDEHSVAAWLSEHADFFSRRPDVLSMMRLPSPHDGKALSLQDRQIEILRERLRQMERKLGEWVHIGRDNEAITQKLLHWVRGLLAAERVEQLPGIVVHAMRTEFAVPLIALRLWRVDARRLSPEWCDPQPDGLIDRVDQMMLPYCGPSADQAFRAWLPSGGVDARSLALIPLRRGIEPASFGLLVLGSGDPDRFGPTMGTAFLERIAEIASAALGRLVDAEPSA